MDRADRLGLSIAAVAHLALFAALGIFVSDPVAPPIRASDPIDISIVDEADLTSAAPAPARAPAPAPPAPAPPLAVAEPTPLTPQPVLPPPAPLAPPAPELITVLPKPAKPVPRKPAKPVVRKPVAQNPVALKSTAAKPAPPAVAVPDSRARRRPGISSTIVTGLADAAPVVRPGVARVRTPASAPGSTAAQMTGPQKSSLNAIIYSQLRPHWKPPSGADAELLVTRLSVRLDRDGSIIDAPEIDSQDGITDSNRGQAKLHAERAIQAVRRAAPFKNLPPQFYDGWKWLRPLKFDGKLSQ